MFPNLIYRRNLIDQSVGSASDNLISQQQQQHQNANNNNSKINKKKIETWPKQNESSSLFQLNTSLLNHLFLTTTTVSQANTTTITTSTPPSFISCLPSFNTNTAFTNSLYSSLALNASCTQNFFNSNSSCTQPTPTFPNLNNIFAMNALAARYNSAIQTQLITVKNDKLVSVTTIQKSAILWSIINGRFVQPDLLPLIFNNNSLTNNLNLQKILLKIFPVS